MSFYPPDLSVDAPIRLAEHDELGREGLVLNLVRALVRDVTGPDGRLAARHATGSVIGLTGPWGSGKSSVLNLLDLRLSSMSQVLVAKFNPWVFSGRDELLIGFLDALRRCLAPLGGDMGEAIRAFDGYRTALQQSATAMGAAWDLHGGTGTGSTVAKATNAALRWFAPAIRSPASQKVALEKAIARSDCAVVVLIDELDRLEDDDIRSVAQLVKAIGDIRGVSYLVAYDAERVIKAFRRSEAEAFGSAYLEKIIQYPVPLRPLMRPEIEGMLFALIGQRSTAPLEQTKRTQELLDCITSNPVTPRDIKRLIGMFGFYDNVLGSEVCRSDLLCYCWILIKYPLLREAVAKQIDDVVDDPDSEEAVIRGVTRDKSIDHPILAATHDDQSRTLITYLFPSVSSLSRSSDNVDGTRIALKRNLIAVLYLGDAPGAMSRVTVDRLLRSDEDLPSRASQLRSLIPSGKLGLAIQRIDDLYRDKPKYDEVDFWIALSASLDRAGSLDYFAVRQSLTGSAVSTLSQMLGSSEGRSLVEIYVSRLIAENDLVLIPAIIRSHIWGYGLAGEPRRRGNYFLPETSFDELLLKEMLRYRAAILDGTMIERLPTLEIAFCLKNKGGWDDELRTGLSNQLKNPHSLASFAAMAYPPGQLIEVSTLQELVDTDALTEQLAQCRSGGDFANYDEWFGLSLKRLWRAARGFDPTFAGYGDDDDDD